jgi:hypothetical protein
MVIFALFLALFEWISLTDTILPHKNTGVGFLRGASDLLVRLAYIILLGRKIA